MIDTRRNCIELILKNAYKLRLASFGLLLSLSLSAWSAEIDFNRDVRPILAENCYFCHGPDKNKRKSGFRLDQQDGAMAKLKSEGFAIVPGKPGQSVLLNRVTSSDEDEHMPPKDSGKSLTPAQIKTLHTWIEQGAKWKAHWSYIPPERAAAPAVQNTAWCRNDIDRFVLSRLEKEGLAPSAEADKRTLIRRLSFDLIGLPPTPEEIDAFVADASDSAYDRLVDRLLSSPHFGERMAMCWLDLVRYADTIGYHSDNPRNIYPYRDYVIHAFNENKPFDRFTIEQLAGDLLPNATVSQKIASGYNRLNMTTEEGGAQAREYEAKYAADRVRNFASVWMAATMGCCECHDHKFDPYSTKDFYSLAAFFADVKEDAIGRREAGMMIPDEKQSAELQSQDTRIAELKNKLETATPELAAAQDAWLNSLKDYKYVEWTPLKPDGASSEKLATLKIDKENRILASGTNPDKDTYTITLRTKLQSITALRLDALPDKSLPKNGPARNSDGSFVVDNFAVNIDPESEQAVVVKTVSASDGTVTDDPGAAEKPLWSVEARSGSENYAVFELQNDLGNAEETKLIITLRHYAGAQKTLGSFRLSATTAARPVRAHPGKELPKDVAQVLSIEPAKRNDQQKQQLTTYFRSITPLLDSVRKDLAEAERIRADFVKTIPTTLVSVSASPRVVRIKPRGNWMDDTGEIVSPAVPHFLRQINTTESRATRLDLANWLVAPENPLTARVFVNRLWKQCFGDGITKSIEDFGTQGEWPIHPELLDWLAVEFRGSGWDIKHTLKVLVTSSTYRQTSVPTKELKERDPYNRLFARQATFRLEAELVRDNALAISGLLSSKFQGESTKPYQPKDYWAFLNFPTRTYQNDHGEKQYARGVYTWWQRSFLHPSLLAFDAPSREEGTCTRSRSNTPQQALTLLNDPTYIEAARVFAAHILKSEFVEERTVSRVSTPSRANRGRDDSVRAPAQKTARPTTSTQERLEWAYRKALGRKPTELEATTLSALYEKHLDEYRKDSKSAEAVMTNGDAPAPKDADAPALAAWTSVARVILNLHETITRF